MKPKVNKNCVANNYSGPHERIIEFSAGGKGGLVSFYHKPEDNTLRVDVYRTDEGVTIQGLETWKGALELAHCIETGHRSGSLELSKLIVKDYETLNAAPKPAAPALWWFAESLAEVLGLNPNEAYQALLKAAENCGGR